MLLNLVRIFQIGMLIACIKILQIEKKLKNKRKMADIDLLIYSFVNLSSEELKIEYIQKICLIGTNKGYFKLECQPENFEVSTGENIRKIIDNTRNSFRILERYSSENPNVLISKNVKYSPDVKKTTIIYKQNVKTFLENIMENFFYIY